MFIFALFHCIRNEKSDSINDVCYPYCVQGFTLRCIIEKMCVNESGGNEWAGRSCDWRGKRAKQIYFLQYLYDRQAKYLRNTNK